MTLTTERLKWIHDAATELSATKLKMTMRPDELLVLTSELLANREAQPVAYTEQCEISNMQATGLYLRGFPDNSQGRNIPLYTAPPAPANAQAVAWEMRYWNSGHGCWHDWERITAEQHAEMSVQHAADNDYEFRVLYDAPTAPEITDDAIDRIVVPLSSEGLDEEKHHCEWHLYHDRERIRKELREYFAAPRSPEELDKYTQGVKDGLEWAARTVEANHPNTCDWLYDDRDDLAKAIRNGPDMLAAAPEGGSDHDTRR